jgi:hypothetical protein
MLFTSAETKVIHYAHCVTARGTSRVFDDAILRVRWIVQLGLSNEPREATTLLDRHTYRGLGVESIRHDANSPSVRLPLGTESAPATRFYSSWPFPPPLRSLRERGQPSGSVRSDALDPQKFSSRFFQAQCLEQVLPQFVASARIAPTLEVAYVPRVAERLDPSFA